MVYTLSERRNTFVDFIKMYFTPFLETPQESELFYASNFGEFEGEYWFGPERPSFRLSVRPSVTLFGSRETQEPLTLESLIFICSMHMKHTRIRIFFLRLSYLFGVMPLFRLYITNLVNNISEEPLWLGS